MTEEREAPKLHHVVFAVAPERRAAVAEMFTEIGFAFEPVELTELGITVHLDWNGGLELISAVPGSTAEVATFVNDFVERHGDGVYTVVLRVPGDVGGRGRRRALRIGNAFPAELLRGGDLPRRDRPVRHSAFR